MQENFNSQSHVSADDVPSAGYSLLEILLALSILLLLNAFIFTYNQRLFFHVRLIQAEQGFIHAANVARVLAIQTGEPVTLCLIDSKEDCIPGPTKEYIVFQLDEHNQKTIIEHSKINLPVSLRWQGFSKGGGIIFTTDGLCYKNGRLFFIDDVSHKTLSQSIVISLSGRVRAG